MSEEAVLGEGMLARIVQDGALLEVREASGELLFTLNPPPHSTFYIFQSHALHGVCPIVSFSVGHYPDGTYGWGDWYYRIDVRSRSMTRLNPWK